MTAMPVVLLDWKEMKRNTLRGFAKIRLGKWMILHDVAVHAGSGRRWATAASKPQIKDGAVVKGDDGKMKYVPIVEWTDREASESFSEGVIAAVESLHPGATAAD